MQVPERNTTMFAGSFNLIKSAIGVGILSLPASMRNAGIVLGLILLAFGSVTTTSTLHFLARIAANTDLGDFFDVGRLAFGSFGEIFAVIVTLVYLFGGLISYASYSSQFLVSFIENTFKVTHVSIFYVTMIVLCCALIFPLALLRDLSKLAKASLAGMVCMAMVCGLIVIDYFVDTSSPAPVYTKFNSSGAMLAFGNILFAFCNHFTMLAIIPTFVDPTPKRRSILTAISSTVVFVFYFLVALFGYLHFGDGVPYKILSVRSNMAYAVAQLLVSIALCLSFPLLCDPAKSCVNLLVTKAMGPPSPSSAHVRNISITAGLVGLSAFCAIFATRIILPVIGMSFCFCGSMLMFVFPAAFFLRLGSKYRVATWERLVAYFDIAFGVLVMIFGTYYSVRSAVASF